MAHLPRDDELVRMDISRANSGRIVLRDIRRSWARLLCRMAWFTIAYRIPGNHPERIIAPRREHDASVVSSSRLRRFDGCPGIRCKRCVLLNDVTRDLRVVKGRRLPMKFCDPGIASFHQLDSNGRVRNVWKRTQIRRYKAKDLRLASSGPHKLWSIELWVITGPHLIEKYLRQLVWHLMSRMTPGVWQCTCTCQCLCFLSSGSSVNDLPCRSRDGTTAGSPRRPCPNGSRARRGATTLRQPSTEIERVRPPKLSGAWDLDWCKPRLQK